MGRQAENEHMTYLILLFIFGIGPLAVLYGTDSRRPFDRRSL